MYRLRAVIAAEHLLRDLASAFPAARIVALSQHLSTLPGEQSAMVWDAGQVVLDHLHLAENAVIPDVGTPVSRALRRLGAVKDVHHDEFDAVGLGRHRDTERWLPSARST
jgi:hypothetical protein